MHRAVDADVALSEGKLPGAASGNTLAVPPGPPRPVSTLAHADLRMARDLLASPMRRRNDDGMGSASLSRIATDGALMIDAVDAATRRRMIMSQTVADGAAPMDDAAVDAMIADWRRLLARAVPAPPNHTPIERTRIAIASRALYGSLPDRWASAQIRIGCPGVPAEIRVRLDDGVAGALRFAADGAGDGGMSPDLVDALTDPVASMLTGGWLGRTLRVRVEPARDLTAIWEENAADRLRIGSYVVGDPRVQRHAP